MPSGGATVKNGRVSRSKTKCKTFKKRSVLKMTAVMSNKGDCLEGNLPNEFLSTGRTGRRNAMPDILDPPIAGSTAAGLPERLQMLTTDDEPQAGPSHSNIQPQPQPSKDQPPQADPPQSASSAS